MSEQRDALENSPGMMKAFENAGIVEDNTEDKSNEAQDGSDTKGGDTNAGTDKTDKVEGDAGKDSLSGKPDGGKKQGKEEKGKDVVDPNDLKLADGTVVKAGAERRHYETAKIAQQKLGIAHTELNDIRAKNTQLETKYTELSNTVKQLGFEDPTQVASAVTLYKDLTRDPKGTMIKLLAEMKALGHTFEGVGGTIDTAALQQLLDARLPNQSSQEQQKPTQEQVNEQATKDVQEFVGRFPDAITHEAHIAALIDRSVEIGKPLSLTDAYFMLKERVVADGLDWSKDLGPQIEARKTTPKQPDVKPRTQGRAVDASAVDPDKVIQPERDMDSDSIVRAAMQEAGFKI